MLGPVQKSGLGVAPDLDDRNVGEAGINELLHRLHVFPDVGAAGDGVGDVVLADELARGGEAMTSILQSNVVKRNRPSPLENMFRAHFRIRRK